MSGFPIFLSVLNLQVLAFHWAQAGWEGAYRTFLQRLAQAWQVCFGAPDLGDEALVGHVEAAHVEHVVNGFHFLHLDGPAVDGLRSFAQHLP